ncbi:MAG: tripartite tricarboxylate transporter substrate-binding protein [Sphaerochaetaceae bacterium]|nr:tripartite tricarboxylate transporter substrate-binding protein [Sphaerochaetaceae bacterium]
MKKKLMVFLMCCASLSMIFANGASEETESDFTNWPEEPITVICPWAVGGVADLVNRKAAVYGEELLGQPVLATNELGAGGNVALTNFLKNKPNSYNLIFGGEGGFSIAPNVDGKEAIMFKYDDFVPVMNMYTATFVMTADASLNIKDLDQLKEYGQTHNCKVAVNGISGSEAFLAKALFKELGIDVTLVSYNGANLALDAVAKGETPFAISHQSQAKGAVEGGLITPVTVFSKDPVSSELFKDVKPVGAYEMEAYYPNTCFLLARKGTSPEVVEKIRNAYLTIMQKEDVKQLFDKLMIEPSVWTSEDMDNHIEHVIQIVKDNQ